MGALFQNVLDASFQGGFLILVVLLLRLALKKAPKRYLCLLWLLVGLRLLVPFRIESEFSLQPDVTQFTQIQSTVNTDSEQPPVTPAVPEVPDNVELPEGDDVEIVVNNNAVLDEQHGVIHWDEIAAYGWIAVAAGLTMYSLISYLHLRRRVREAVKLYDGVWECDRIETAFILGYLRPQIYLPMGLSEADRLFILEHEWLHLRRGDHWARLVGFAALTVHWFNPLVWVAYGLLCRDMEMACDERVIQNMGVEERKCYSAALLSCSSNHHHFAACPVAFGEVSVKQRILAVLNYRKPRFWITAAAVIVVIITAVCFLTNPVKKIDPMTLEDWGVTMTAVESNSTGVTVAFDLPEKAEGHFVFNFGEWALQVESDGEWVDVPMLPQEEPDIPWNGHVSMLFPNEIVQRVALDWTTVYGKVTPGRYRVRGTLMLVQDGLGHNKDFYAEFWISDTGEQMTQEQAQSEEWKAECRAVLDKIQSKEHIHILEQRRFEGESVLNDSADVNYFRAGNCKLRIIYIDDCDEFDGHLALGDKYYWDVSNEAVFEWVEEDRSQMPDMDPWLYSFDLNEQEAEAVSREETDEGYEIRLLVYAPYFDLGESYYVDFCFDHQGNFLRAVQYVSGMEEILRNKWEEHSIVSAMCVVNISETDVLSTIEEYAGELVNVE